MDETELDLQEALRQLDEAYGDTIKTIDELHKKKIDLIVRYKQKEDEAKLRAARESLFS
jgi:hypothetical protein